MKAAVARSAASYLAACTFDRSPNGKATQVTDPKARAALARGFARSITRRSKPQLLRMSVEEARGFPSFLPVTAAPQWSHWIMVGFDVVGRGTFVMQATLTPPGMPLSVLRNEVTRMISPRFRESCADPSPLETTP